MSSGVEAAISVAATKLGYSQLRDQQALAIRMFLQDNDIDVFVSLPTGSGKSLCYCILPAVFDAIYGAGVRDL
jgi:ATP-dependent DNA helicase RecQ